VQMAALKRRLVAALAAPAPLSMGRDEPAAWRIVDALLEALKSAEHG